MKIRKRLLATPAEVAETCHAASGDIPLPQRSGDAGPRYRGAPLSRPASSPPPGSSCCHRAPRHPSPQRPAGQAPASGPQPAARAPRARFPPPAPAPPRPHPAGARRRARHGPHPPGSIRLHGRSRRSFRPAPRLRPQRRRARPAPAGPAPARPQCGTSVAPRVGPGASCLGLRASKIKRSKVETGFWPTFQLVARITNC
ncbi:proline-rich protein 2-like [Manacus vitellinus]|uniref:proline-rich protein 2-like n=1 Tax=Manacus vitellinus TaxID=328815 RepID=UPI00115F03CF|nr:proline-rich protein 2-like [Manacus vitellinus]